MKCKVRLTRMVEMFVEGKDEDAIMDWLSCTTPEEAFELAGGHVNDDVYEDEIVCEVREDSVVDYVIPEEE